MRVLVTNYSFNKSTKQITFTDYASIILENVLLVTDVTNNTTIYQANDPAKGGSVSGNVLTVAYDTTGSSFANGDKLQIFYEVPYPTDGSAKTQVVNGSGTSVSAKTLSTQVSGTDVGLVTNTVIHGYTGSAFVDVKASASGALLTDGSAVTQPVSAASLPLPTGAATSAKQPALGIAGTPSSDVLTVQGATSMTPLKVDGSAVTQPVSGTVTANVQGGNSTAVKVDGSTVTQPISAASLPLPTGAATAAKQPALGTAGTPSTDVITVQGAASMTALKVDGSAVTQPVSGSVTVSGTVTANLGTIDGVATEATLAETHGAATGGTAASKSELVGAVYNSSAPILTNGQQVSLQSNSSGALKVDGSAVTHPVSQSGTWNINNISGTVSLPTGAATAAKQPELGTAGTASADVLSVQGVASMVPFFVEGSAATGTTLVDNPLASGGLAKTANPTAVTDGQAVYTMHDKLGRQVVVPGHVRDLVTNNYVQLTTATETTILAAGGAGVFHDLTSLVITSASNQAVNVTIRDATAGTTRMVLNVAANGGVVFNPAVALKQATANNNWTAQLSAAVTVNIAVIAVKNI